MKPHAVLGVRPDRVARVCAWCPDKALADEWCEARGYEISHGICDACKNKTVIPSTNPIREEIKRLEKEANARSREGGQTRRECDQQSKSGGGESQRREGRSPSAESLGFLPGFA